MVEGKENCRSTRTPTDQKKKRECKGSGNHLSLSCFLREDSPLSHTTHTRTRSLPSKHKMARPAVLAALVVLAVAAGSGECVGREEAGGRPAAISRRAGRGGGEGGITTASPLSTTPPTLSLLHCARDASMAGRQRAESDRAPCFNQNTHTHFPPFFTHAAATVGAAAAAKSPASNIE